MKDNQGRSASNLAFKTAAAVHSKGHIHIQAIFVRVNVDAFRCAVEYFNVNDTGNDCSAHLGSIDVEHSNLFSRIRFH